MSKLLRGNFETKNDTKINKDSNSVPGDDLDARFERAALARLGGSIGYVSRKKFLWNEENEAGEKNEKQMPTAGRAAQYDNE